MPAPPPTDPDRAHRRFLRLEELAAAGMNMMHMVETQSARLILAEAPATIARSLPELANAYIHLARSLRQTMALEARLEQAPDLQLQAEQVRHQHRSSARRHVIRKVENLIDQRAKQPLREALLSDLYERLDDPEFEEALATTDPDILIDQITKDLGIGSPLTPHGKPRTRAEIALLHARAAIPARAATHLGASRHVPTGSPPSTVAVIASG